MELRPYQQRSIGALWDWFRNNPEGAPLLVLPTGAGKSLVLAEVARKICEKGKHLRVLILAHRKELLSQNLEKLRALMPWGDVTAYSAGLKKKDASGQVVVAGIQSVYKKADELGKFALVIIDECHLIPHDGEGIYRTLIDGLKAVNPAIRFLGLTATPYRLSSGMLVHEEALFTDIAYETAMSELIEAGYLSPLVSKSGKSKPNLTLISTRAGEYNLEEMERAFNRYDIVDCAVLEIIKHGVGRKAWLLFTSGVQHAESVGKALEKGEISYGIITGETPPMIRASLLEDYKEGRITALVGVDVFTTGFDVPKVDLIAVLRATKSVGLWVQICGRGTRKAEGKENCVILDFGGNALAHGPVDCINIKRRWNPLTGKDEAFLEKVPVKECGECGAILAINARECGECGVVFPILARISHGPEASSAPIMSGDESLFIGTVQSVRYEKHTSKKSGGISMRVDYLLVYDPAVPTARISEYVMIGRDGWQGMQATKWWYEHGASLDNGTPRDVDESVARAPGELLSPKKIEFKRDGKYWRVNKVIEFHERGQGGPITIEEESEFFDDTGINL